MAASQACLDAIRKIRATGKALFKRISPNDLDITGGHQYGFYLPKSAGEILTDIKPEKGVKTKHFISICWQNDLITESVITWYGKKTRSEYRLTRFGHNFPWRKPELLGDILVLIPETSTNFSAFVLSTDDDFDEIALRLGIEVGEWSVYHEHELVLSAEDCLVNEFSRIIKDYSEFPSTLIMSQIARKTLEFCGTNFLDGSNDTHLIESVNSEYALFRLMEEKFYLPEIRGGFSEINPFIELANSILNRRKSRAGRSLENHTEYLLDINGIPYFSQSKIEGRPDIMIPNDEAYYKDPSLVTMLAIKRTCKDRWRQILKEAPNVSQRYLLTLQEGISENQLKEMKNANVSLIVPKELHKFYPPAFLDTLLSVDQFMDSMLERYNG
ncbi:type II restriction endonuclease [bacterium]|nr:type II restriction endonuclease [bacterium]